MFFNFDFWPHKSLVSTIYNLYSIMVIVHFYYIQHFFINYNILNKNVNYYFYFQRYNYFVVILSVLFKGRFFYFASDTYGHHSMKTWLIWAKWKLNFKFTDHHSIVHTIAERIDFYDLTNVLTNLEACTIEIKYLWECLNLRCTL